MSLSDYVSTARASLGDGARVRLLADSEALRGVVPEDATVAGEGGEGTDDAAGAGLTVAHAPLGDEVAALQRLGSSLGERGLGVLALVADPGVLPVGPLVAAAAAAGLRVVRAEGIHHRRARTVLTVTRDPEVPVAAYLAENDVASGAAASARLANEWLVEGLALRARADDLAERLRGSEDEVRLLRVRVDDLTAGAKAERAAVQAELEEARRAVRVEKARAAQGPGLRARRAVSLLRQDPVEGSRRIARAAARRLQG